MEYECRNSTFAEVGNAIGVDFYSNIFYVSNLLDLQNYLRGDHQKNRIKARKELERKLLKVKTGLSMVEKGKPHWEWFNHKNSTSEQRRLALRSRERRYESIYNKSGEVV